MSDEDETLPPEPTDRSRPYWEAAKDERFVLQHCTDCGTYLYYPRDVCTNCFGADLTWKTASGRGSVLTYTVVFDSPVSSYENRTPYVLAVVELEEGPRMMSNIINCRPEVVAIDDPVTVTFEHRDGRTLPQFELKE